MLLAHLAWILWVIAGAAFTRGRARLRWFHLASLVWGMLVELTSWPCPLTLLGQWLEIRAGAVPYRQGFLLHYLDKLVYPDISPVLLTWCGVAVCAFNLAIYARRAVASR